MPSTMPCMFQPSPRHPPQMHLVPSIHIHLSFCPISPSILFHLIFSLSTSQALSLSLSVSSLFQFINLSSISLPPIHHLSPSHSHLIPPALSSSCTTPGQPSYFVLLLPRIQSRLAPVDTHLEAGPHVCCHYMHTSAHARIHASRPSYTGPSP